jgi:hypothetical protein
VAERHLTLCIFFTCKENCRPASRVKESETDFACPYPQLSQLFSDCWRNVVFFGKRRCTGCTGSTAGNR